MKRHFEIVGTVAALLLAANHASAIVISSAYSANYTAASIGPAPGVPTIYAGVAFNPSDPNTLYIAGNAFSTGGGIYAVQVTRNTAGHITGFAGTASLYSTAPNISNGGLVFGPGNVLFYTAGNNVGEIKPGSTSPDKVVVAPVGTADTTLGTLAFNPYNGAFDITSYLGATVFDTTLSADGSGTYNISSPSYATPFLGPHILGLFYPPLTAPQFSSPSVILADKGEGELAIFQLDSNGHLIPGTSSLFATIPSMEGSTTDPLTGDLLLTDYSGLQGTNAPFIDVIQGFSTPAPEPASLTLFGCAATILITRRRP
jgi:hypothetical protein